MPSFLPLIANLKFGEYARNSGKDAIQGTPNLDGDFLRLFKNLKLHERFLLSRADKRPQGKAYNIGNNFLFDIVVTRSVSDSFLLKLTSSISFSSRKKEFTVV